MMIRELKYILPALALLAVSCGDPVETDPVETPAPKLVSMNPADGTGDLTASTLSVTFTFDQNILCTATGLNAIQVDNAAFINESKVDGAKLLVMVGGLRRGVSYTVTVPAGTVKGYKQNQKAADAISYHFSMKEPDPTPPGPDTGTFETAAEAVKNMGVGWNLGNTLESNSGDVDNMWIEAYTSRRPTDYENAWGQTDATRALIHMFKEAGFNAIRVPVSWYPHMGNFSSTVSGTHWDKAAWLSSTNYTVDPVWMARVKEVVGYVIDEGMYCILNVHHDTGTYGTSWLRADQSVYAAVKDRYCDLWKQIATEFKDFGPTLLFESFNEMLDATNTWNYASKEADQVINAYNADFVATVRATGGNNAERNLVLNTYAASPDARALQDFVLPNDSAQGHLMAEVHSYAPYQFAFNVTPARPTFDASCDQEVRAIVDGLNTYLVSRGIPCILGEFGVDTNIRGETEEAKQAACYVSQATKYNIPCFYWMALSDGKEDRAAPRWTKPTLRDAILKAYKDNKTH